MIDLAGALGEHGKKYNDEDPIFYDGILRIICELGDNYVICTAHRIVLTPEYDEPLSLADIAKKYRNVKKVIYETWTSGMIFNYKNHKDGEDWELVGTTIGFI